MRDYKADMESFHSGQLGSDVSSIILFVLHAPALVFILSSTKRTFRIKSSRFQCIALEFLLLVVPLLLAMTLLSHLLWTTWLIVMSMVCCIVLYHTVSKYAKLKDKRIIDGDSEVESYDCSTVGKMENNDDDIVILYHFKGVVVLVTCMAILGVDFNVFPRKFCKTEEYGTSLMDVGTGLFVTSSALTSKFLRHFEKDMISQRNNSIVERVFFQVQKNMHKMKNLFILGVLRFVFMKNTEYQEHVSEYGIHWNFFFTLGFLWLFADIVHAIAQTPKRSVSIGLIIGIAHQSLLVSPGFAEYIFHGPRQHSSFLLANREGILSVAGLLSVYLVGEGMSYICFGRIFKNISRLKKLAGCFCMCWFVWSMSNAFVQETSRRLSNGAYGTLTLTVTFLLLLVFQMGSDFFSHYYDYDKKKMLRMEETSTVLLLSTLTNYSLYVFLVANILTGCVNLTISTLTKSDEEAIIILITYLLVICVGSVKFSHWVENGKVEQN